MHGTVAVRLLNIPTPTCSCSGQVLLLLRNSKHNDKTWGLPGGNVEEGEELLQAAMREATEEMGHTPEHRIIREIITK